MQEWAVGSDVTDKRLIRLAKFAFGSGAYIDGLTKVIADLAFQGHRNGTFDVSNLYLGSLSHRIRFGVVSIVSASICVADWAMHALWHATRRSPIGGCRGALE